MSEPTPEELADADAATVDDLAASPERVVSDQTANRILEAEAKRQDQANELRPRFFWSVVAAMSFTLVASVGIMAAYLWSQWGEVEPGVMIAWMSAAVVETIGLAYIVANYLFPGSAPKVRASSPT